MPDPELVAAISALLSPLAGVSEKKTATHATFLVGKKIFAFTRSGGGRGMALKLPAARVTELCQRSDISPLVMGKRTMKEWILLDHTRLADYKKDVGLFKEAMTFAAATPSKPKMKR
jgi:predicted DNA-binding protein (MmcQ/YjbR family)